MADIGGYFDANDVEPNAPFEVLPPGDYSMQILDSAMETTSRGDGRFLKIEMEVTDGDSAGRKIFDRLNLVNPNETAVKIARQTLSAIARAVGVLTFKDSSDLHMRKMIVKVAVVPRKDKQGNIVDGEYSNEVKGYRAVEGGAPAGSGGTPAKTGFTPSTGSTGAGATAGGGGKPPWKK